MAKKKNVEKALNIDSILFNCRDYLRAARNSGSFFEKRDMMLTLVFLRFIGEKYEDGVEKLKQTLKEQGLDPEDENMMKVDLRDQAGITTNALAKLGKNEHVSTQVLEKVCKVLHCEIQDIMEFVPDEEREEK